MVCVAAALPAEQHLVSRLPLVRAALLFTDHRVTIGETLCWYVILPYFGQRSDTSLF